MKFTCLPDSRITLKVLFIKVTNTVSIKKRRITAYIFTDVKSYPGREAL